MYNSITNILKLELSRFINEESFDEVLPLLYSIKKKYILTCLYGYAKIENIKTTFRNDIINELKKYRQRKKILDELEENESFVITNLKTIINLRENLLKETDFYNTYSQINTLTKIKCKIKNLLKNNKKKEI